MSVKIESRPGPSTINVLTSAFETRLEANYRNEHEDLTIVACGPMVPEAMRAAWILKKDFGYETRILNIHTMKPIDTTTRTVLEDERALEWGYQSYIDPRDRVPYATEEGMQVVIDSLVDVLPDVGKLQPAALVDNSLLRELESEGFVAALYRS